MDKLFDSETTMRRVSKVSTYVICVIACVYVLATTVLAFAGGNESHSATIVVEDVTEASEKVVEDTLEPEIVEAPIENIEESLIFPEEPVVDIVEFAVLAASEMPAIPFNVPLDVDLQNYILEVCGTYGVDPLLVMAIIQQESQFKTQAIGDRGRSYGLMQIQPRWHSARMTKLGVTDLLDPYQNVTVGIDILAEIQSMGGSLEWVLMSYNGGYTHANNHIANGTISNYAVAVKNYMNTIERN